MGVTDSENVGVAMALVIGAGAATGLGASVVFFPSLVKLASRRTLASALGLSAGVMTYVSFAEIFIKAQDSFGDAGFDEDQSKIYATLCFFAGVVAMILLNALVTYLLGGGHHHGGHGHTRTTDPREDSSVPGDDESETSEPVAPCPCHDENPIETLDKVKGMAESMHVHPNRPHPEGYHHNHPSHPKHVETHVAAPDEGQQVGEQGQTPDQGQPMGEQVPTQEVEVPAPDLSEKEASVEPLQMEFNVDEENRNASVEDKLDDENAHSVLGDDEEDDDDDEEEDAERNKKLVRMSLNTALAIGLHNFPEGLATFVAALDDPKVGAVLAMAIAIHNIPEGLCVAMPIYYATGNKWKAFGWALLSGIAEPIAGLLGWLILAQSFSDQLYALLFGMVAGMMVIISVRELLPTAHRYDPEDGVVTYSFIVGMGIMALSLMLFLL